MNIEPSAPLRKRRLSKPADGGGQQPDEQARLWGEGFGVGSVVEALRAKVDVERVVGRLLVWRREGEVKGEGKGEDGVEGEGTKGGEGIGGKGEDEMGGERGGEMARAE